ncbi:hypothetical protein BY996DRAFT_4575168 [Phakopsora pachyrhizi]|uniref:Expressed protein n=1 Tax=Phakopsora pachyrhizi TaxID=170000 RepID=A0AAV0BIE3_PHAPC|nr:hypothetical protein BY996DRAFT_4575168 [Phakopsora pachyrhizi]CAH7686084.1 expressed protein [Phakopsora pachyrhizi]
MTGDLSSITKTLQKGLKLSEPKELQNGIHSSDVGGAWGAAYAIGTPVSALITGVCCSLAIEYFQKFPEDVPRIRGSVIVVVATTIVGLFIAIDLTYLRLVKNQAPPGGFEDVPWQDDAVALVCGICQLICSAYFGYSVYSVATKKKLVVAWYSLLMIVIFLATFFRAIFGLGTDWFDGAALCPKMTFMWLICSLLLDFSIAVTLLAHLRSPISSKVAVGNPYTPATVFPAPMNSSETNYKNRAPILNRFLTTILTTFSLTVTLMLSLLVLILTMHGTEFDPNYPKTTGIFTALRLLTTPTYAVTFLYTLNRRKPMGTARGFSVDANVGLYDAEIGGRINNSNQTGNKNESAQQIKGDLQKIKGNWVRFASS